MTGRTLYDRFTDALAETRSTWGSSDLPGMNNETPPPDAWPYLSTRDKRVWNALARKITPKPKRVKP